MNDEHMFDFLQIIFGHNYKCLLPAKYKVFFVLINYGNIKKLLYLT